MLNIHFASPSLDWSQSMRDRVMHDLLLPLQSRFSELDGEVAIHVDRTFGQIVLWAVLQTFDRQANEIVRCQGDNFSQLVNEATGILKQRLQRRRRSWWKKLLKSLSLSRAPSPQGVF